MPSELVTAEKAKLVPFCTTRTATFGATAPVESVTRPVMVDVPIWANAASEVARIAAISLFMDHPPNGGDHITNRSQKEQFLRSVSPASHIRGSYSVISVNADIFHYL